MRVTAVTIGYSYRYVKHDKNEGAEIAGHENDGQENDGRSSVESILSNIKWFAILNCMPAFNF